MGVRCNRHRRRRRTRHRDTISRAHPHRDPAVRRRDQTQLAAVAQAFQQPTLTWLFCLAAGMYTFSHVPFVFGQPFILEAINAARISLDASIASGMVTATMMLISVATSWLAPTLQSRFGVGRIFLFALAMQVVVIACLAITNHPAAIALLFLRMVPDSLGPPLHPRAHPSAAHRQRPRDLPFRAKFLRPPVVCNHTVFECPRRQHRVRAGLSRYPSHPDVLRSRWCLAVRRPGDHRAARALENIAKPRRRGRCPPPLTCAAHATGLLPSRYGRAGVRSRACP